MYAQQNIGQPNVIKTGKLPRDIWDNFIMPCFKGTDFLRVEKINRYLYS